MKRWRVLVSITVPAVLIAAVAAYALTSGEFLPRSEKWAKTACTKTLLKSVSDEQNNEKITLCYAFLKLKDDNAALAALGAQVGGIESGVAALKTTVGNLEKEVAALKKEGGAPAPQDFIFFTNELSETSPTFDAKNYTHVLFSSTCGPPGAEIELRVEASPDESHWITQTSFKCGSETPHEPLPTAGRYYRLTAEVPLGLSSLFVEGRFSA
jgi:hypothetical protein